MQGRILCRRLPNDEPSFRELETSVGVANSENSSSREIRPLVTEKKGPRLRGVAKTILEKRLRRKA
jgi:hypothetical protein